VVVVAGGAGVPASAASQPLTYTGMIGGPRLFAPEGVAVDGNGDVLVVEPNAPSDPSDDRLAKFTPGGSFLDVIAGPGSAAGQMYDPSGVAVAPNGNIYTVEKGVDRLQQFDPLGNYLASVGGVQGSGSGQFKNPEGVAVDAQGKVYVADTGNFRIQVFDPTLLPGDPFVTSWCIIDNGPSGCSGSVTGVAVSGSTVFTVGSSTVRTYDRVTGTPGVTWSSTGGTGIAVDGSGDVWVTSTGDIVREYSPTGALLATQASGQLLAPQGLAFDGNKMYVADTGDGRIARFSVTGPDLSWSVPAAVATAVAGGVVYVVDGSSVQTFDTSGSPGPTWSSPGSAGIAVDASGNVWVSSSAGTVTEYDSGGSVLQTVGATYLSSPQGIALSSGKLFVADPGASKIFRFSTAGGAPETSWVVGGALGVAVDAGTVYAVTATTVRTYSTSGVAGPTWSSTSSAGITTDGAGNVWVSSTAGPLVREFDSAGTLLATVGGPGTLTTPAGIAFGGSKLYVADGGAGAVARFTIGAYDLEWGAFPGNGVMDSPTGLAVDASGNTYVTDAIQNLIQKFAPDGTYLTAFGGSGITLLSNPTAIAIGPGGNVYVADKGNHRIEVFSPTGTYLDRWGSFGSLAGQFSSPSGIAVDASGNVYVADTGNNRIEMFDASHVLQWVRGTTGTSGGQFKAPKGLTLDSSGNVWVADSTNNRIQELDGAGNFIKTWGTGGPDDGELSVPSDIEFGADGLAYVSDKGNDRIQIFTASGTFLSVLGGTGLDTGEFSAPIGIAIDPTSLATRLLVADSANNRVETFIDQNGPDTTLQTFPAPTTTQTSASFTFTAADVGATFECKLDGAVGWDPTCNGSASGSASYTSLTEGAHSFVVRARDVANNPGNPTTYDWTIDRTAPTVSVTGGPAEGQTDNATHPAFSFDADEPVLGFSCSLDGAAYAACASGDQFAVSNGSHTFTVRANDLAGNTGVSATRHWTVDTTPPTINITSGPSGTVVSTGASFSFTSPSDPSATFTCDIDGTGFSSCTSPWTYPTPPLAPGQHTFKVIATDALGNASAPAQRKWTIDTATHRPDALIATGSSYTGDGVYNGTGTGQTKTAKGKPGATVKFKVQIQNDGNDQDPITLTGPGSGNGYTISYFDGTSNVTNAVKGGTCTFDLNGGQSKVITVKVKVGSSASTSKTLLIVATSGHDPSKSDAVKAIVKRA
jgi:sugar lactone lactonase YvrE